MKKLFSITALTLLIAASSANGQVLFGFGLKGGAVRAEQSWEYTPSWLAENSYKSSIWGFDIGAYTGLVSISDFTLQVEIHYTQKGKTTTVIETILADNPQGYIDLGPREIKSRFHYLSMPVLIKFSPDLWVVRPFIAAGPSLEYLVSHPQSPTYDQFNRAEIAGTISVGAELSLGFIHALSGEVRYTQELTNSFQNESVTVKTSTLAFLLGVSF
jgi:hypothetical protein